MAEKIYDVAIAGGGLAGLCLSIQCAKAGLKTILFEKEHYPFHKVCGEYISLESLSFLQQLGFNPFTYHLPIIKKLLVTDVQGNPYHFPLPLGGFGVSRYTLDNALYQIALANGVTVIYARAEDFNFDNQLFSIANTAHPCKATVAVGCFGKRSNIDVKWKRPFTTKKAAGKNYIGIKYHIKYDHDADEIALHNFNDGYCGISKIEDDKSCLCYLTTARQLQAAGNSIKKLESNVLSANPRLRHIFSKATFLYEPLAISQISFAEKSVVENHVLMAGDSAGLITPLCGNGMSMAMHASKLCLEAIEPFIKDHTDRMQMEIQYAKEWKKQFSSRLTTGRIVQKFFGHPAATSLF